MKKVLVLGASGFIGKAICQTMGDTYQVFGTYFSNKEKNHQHNDGKAGYIQG